MAGAGSGRGKDVVLITGCTDGGIGAGMALEFAREGFTVVATSRSLGSMKELSSHDNIHCRAMDVTDYVGAKAAVDNIIADYGHIDILVNNAGVPCVAPVAEIPISLLESTFKTNVFGPVVLINAVVPQMVERGRGKIVNVGSIVSLCPGPMAGGYVGSKAALEALTDALRSELRPFGIDVVLLLPGAIRSNIGNNSSSIIKSEVLEGLKIFKPWEKFLMELVSASQSSKSTPTAVFVKKAVAQVLAKSPPAHFAYGHLATLFSIMYYMPFWFRDFVWSKYCNLDKSVVRAYNKKLE